MKLYTHQDKLIKLLRADLKTNRRVIMQAATGFGKTICFSYMVSEAAKRGKKCLVVTDRSEILKQAGGAFESFGLSPEYIKPTVEPCHNQLTYVAMVETLFRRADRYAELLNSFDLVIFDEAHKTAFDKLFPYLNENCFVIGATATPLRTGNQPSLDEFYTSIVNGVESQYLIENKFLSTPKYYGVTVDLSGVKKLGGDYNSKQLQERYMSLKTYRGVVSNYQRLTPNKKAIVFCAGIEQSKEACDAFVEHGYNAKHLDSNMSTSEREDVLKWYNQTPNGILCNVGIATTGFDQPDIEVCILYRATTSLVLFMQMVGRAARVTDKKKEFTVLDFGNNVTRFGFWEQYRDWNLKKPKKKEGDVAPVKDCPKCNALVAASVMICPECNYVFPPPKNEPEPIVELAEIESKVPKHIRGEYIADLNIEQLVNLQASKAYSAAFIWRVVRSKGKEEISRYAQAMGYSNGWVIRQQRESSSFTNFRLK